MGRTRADGIRKLIFHLGLVLMLGPWMFGSWMFGLRMHSPMCGQSCCPGPADSCPAGQAASPIACVEEESAALSQESASRAEALLPHAGSAPLFFAGTDLPLLAAPPLGLAPPAVPPLPPLRI